MSKLGGMKTLFTLCLLLVASLAIAQNFTHTETTLPVEDKTTKAVITLPEGDGPFPALVIVAGSGATDLDGNTYGLQGKNNSLKMLAEALAEKGYASLRYNKRIFAGFSEVNLTFEDFVTDAVNAYKMLDEHPKTAQVGFAGHSQGSLVCMLAARQVNAAFYISIAGAGQAFDEIISKQLHANPANPKPLIEKAEEIMAELKKGNTVSEVPPVLASLFRPTVQNFIGSWMKYSPTEEIAKLKIPSLIINGTNDIQVSVEDAKMLHGAATAKKVLLTIDKMNHVLKDAPEERQANIATYSDEKLALSIGLIPGITSFLGVILAK